MGVLRSTKKVGLLYISQYCVCRLLASGIGEAKFEGRQLSIVPHLVLMPDVRFILRSARRPSPRLET